MLLFEFVKGSKTNYYIYQFPKRYLRNASPELKIKLLIERMRIFDEFLIRYVVTDENINKTFTLINDLPLPNLMLYEIKKYNQVKY